MWKFVCLLLSFTVLLANADKKFSLEKSSSASDELDEDFPSRHGKRLQFREEGLSKAEECLQMGKFDGKVCDPDDLLNGPEEELLKVALRELETVTVQPMHPDQFQRGGIKFAVLLMKNVKDIKETDDRIYEIVKNHADERPFDRIGVIVLSFGGSSDFLGQQTLIRRNELSNIPIYAYSAGAGVWSNFYSTSTLNAVIPPSEIIRLFNNESPLLREGTYAVALLDIIHGIRDRVLIKQGKMFTERTLNQVQSLSHWPEEQQSLDFSQPRASRQTANDEMYKVERCLEHFEAKVCDPDDMLNAEEQNKVDSALMDLESSTGEFGQEQRINSHSNSCKQGGVKLATIVIKSVQDQQSVDRKINEMLFKRSMSHPCERAAVMMLSPGPDYRNRPHEQIQQQQTFDQQTPLNYDRFPVAVWSKFYGISNINVPVPSWEIVQFYNSQKLLIRQGKYGDALLNIISDFKHRVLSGRTTRQTETETINNFDVQPQNEKQNERRQGKKMFKKLTAEEEQVIFDKLDKCLQSIKPKVCDLERMLVNDEREIIENELDELEKDSSSHSTETSTQKGFILTVVVMPYTSDITEHEKLIAERLSQWREAHPREQAAVMMLSAERDQGGLYDRSKFYGTSTRNSVVRPTEFVRLYNNNKFLIRTGKHHKALLNIIKKIHDKAMNRQQGIVGN